MSRGRPHRGRPEVAWSPSDRRFPRYQRALRCAEPIVDIFDDLPHNRAVHARADLNALNFELQWELGDLRCLRLHARLWRVSGVVYEQTLSIERCCPGLSFGIALGKIREHTDPAHPVGLVRAHCERPRGRAGEPRDELASSYVERGLPSRNPLCQLTARQGCPGRYRQVLGMNLNRSEWQTARGLERARRASFRLAAWR
jgi:hypothetical protein